MKHMIQILIATILTIAFAIVIIYFGENNYWVGWMFSLIGYFMCIGAFIVFLAWAIVDEIEEEEEDVE